MTLDKFTLRGLVIIALTTTLLACGKNSAQNSEPKLVTTSEVSNQTPSPDTLKTPESTGNSTLAVEGTLPEEDNPLAAVVGASEIPYPMYPNGIKYRVGGENGLKIVVFQTQDAFEKVDDYYNKLSANEGMARLNAMSDYVRYSNEAEDLDPWATHKPGIVIHEFDDDDDRQAVGASEMAKTNIIMSF